MNKFILDLGVSFNKVFLLISAFLMPIKPLLLTVGFFIILDTIFAIYRSYKIGIEITSRRFSGVISKMFLYQIVVISAFILEKIILTDFIYGVVNIDLFLTKLVALVLISNELKSLDENYKILYRESLWEKAKKLLKRGISIKKEIQDYEN